MTFNTISSVVIYTAMFGFLYACINPGRMGLIRLYRLSQDLRSAAAQLKDRDFCNNLERQIRGGTPNAADCLFSTKVLSEQMHQYCDSIYYLELNPGDKCRTDINEYINYDLLHQQGRVDLCEHTASGFTALGLLGTFLGINFGLASLSQGNSQQIITGIDGLLDGMGLAFLTSILGIILSLTLGTALRLILAGAESNLELFLTLFRSNVMRNQSEAALNEIIQQISSIKSGLDTANELQVSTLDRTVSAFISKLNKEMGLQIGFLQSAIQDMGKEQRTYNNSIQDLTTQMNHTSRSLQNVSNSFLPVLNQSAALSEQFKLANQSLKSSIEDIHNLLQDDAAALSRHQQLQAGLMRTSEAMQDMAASIQLQSAELIKHHHAIASDHQKALNSSLTQFAQASRAISDSLVTYSIENITALQEHARKLMDSMPQQGVSTIQLNRLLEQNQAIIDQQAKLIRIMEEQPHRAAHRWIRRPKK